MIRTLIASVFLLAEATVVVAQSNDSPTVPRALAEALLQYAGTGDFVTITDGKLPSDQFAPIVPQGARVLGGAIHRGGFGGMSNPKVVAILAFTVPADSARELIAAALAHEHWKPAPDPGAQIGGGGGFVAFGAPTESYRQLAYCGDTLSMWGMAYKDRSGGSLAEVSLQNKAGTMCDSELFEQMIRPSYARFKLPDLEPPAGSRLIPGGTGSDGESVTMNATLESTQDAAAIIEYFRPQLEKQGWTLGKKACDPEVCVQTAKSQNDKGKTMYLTLMDRVLAAGVHESMLRVANERPPNRFR